MKKRVLLIGAIAAIAAASTSARTLDFSGANARPKMPDKPLGATVESVPDPQGGGSTHSVTLTWVAPVIPSGSACVLSGYNVKRSTTSGAEVTIASPTSSPYTDTAVTSGAKYFYVATALYGTTCTESAPSNEATAQIPLDAGPPPSGLVGSPK